VHLAMCACRYPIQQDSDSYSTNRYLLTSISNAGIISCIPEEGCNDLYASASTHISLCMRIDDRKAKSVTNMGIIT